MISFPNRLEIHPLDLESKLLKELRKFNISVPILQAIKEVYELNKMVKELCIRKGGRRKKFYPKTIQVDGKLVDLLLGKLVNPKYGDLGSPIITILIRESKILNVLVDLGATINVMVA